MSVFQHQVGGDPLHIHELFLYLAAIGGFGFSMLVLLKVQIREWFTRLILRNPQAEDVTKDKKAKRSRR